MAVGFGLVSLVFPVLAIVGLAIWFRMFRRYFRDPGAPFEFGLASFAAAAVQAAALAVAVGLFAARAGALESEHVLALAFMSAGAAIPAQAIVCWLSRRASGGGKLLSFIAAGLAVVTVMSGLLGWAASPSHRIARTLEAARLAPLPQSAANVRMRAFGVFSLSNRLIMFSAPSTDIERFVAASPSLAHAAPEVFTAEHQRLPNGASAAGAAGRPVLFIAKTWLASWFDPTIRVKGRGYILPMPGRQSAGALVINDETNTVYIDVP